MHLASLLVAPLAIMAITCPSGGLVVEEAQLTREQAIEIARQEVSFEPESTEAVRTTSEEREVWRVTFRGRLPGQPPSLSEMMIVEIDAHSGEVVSLVRT